MDRESWPIEQREAYIEELREALAIAREQKIEERTAKRELWDMLSRVYHAIQEKIDLREVLEDAENMLDKHISF